MQTETIANLPEHSHLFYIERGIAKSGNDYTMTMEYYMRDFYDWDPNDPKMSPIVSPAQMHDLHCAGMAKEFEVEGQMVVTVSWSQGQTVGTGATYQVVEE